MLVTLLVFLAVLGVMVFVHELGHFLVAKKAGVRVEEFAFGFRPRLLAKKVGDTTYALNLIPLGGYVKMYGEQNGELGPGSYKSKSAPARAAILVAGSTMNLLMAWVILTILFISGFQPFFPNASDNPFISEAPAVVVGRVIDDSPAAVAGLQTGDELLGIVSTNKPDDISQQVKVTSTQQFVQAIDSFRGQSISIFVQRLIPNGYPSRQLVAVNNITPRLSPPVGQGALGIAVGESGQVKATWGKAPLAALYETGRIIAASAVGFVGFIKELIVKQHVSDQVTGIIGVGALTGVARRLGFAYLAQLVALISVGLGVVNLMPILPLDGGQLAVLIYEKATRRSLTERQFSYFATVGLVFILLIFAIVTFKDIARFNILGRIF